MNIKQNFRNWSTLEGKFSAMETFLGVGIQLKRKVGKIRKITICIKLIKTEYIIQLSQRKTKN